MIHSPKYAYTTFCHKTFSRVHTPSCLEAGNWAMTPNCATTYSALGTWWPQPKLSHWCSGTDSSEAAHLTRGSAILCKGAPADITDLTAQAPGQPEPLGHQQVFRATWNTSRYSLSATDCHTEHGICYLLLWGAVRQLLRIKDGLIQHLWCCWSLASFRVLKNTFP